jgi:hypothetical protein
MSHTIITGKKWAAALKNGADHLEWLAKNRISDPKVRAEAMAEVENARDLLRQWESVEWDEKREHDKDLEFESRETEEREATGYWDNCPD